MTFTLESVPVAGETRGTVAAVSGVAESHALAAILTRRRLTRNVLGPTVASSPSLLALTLVRAASVVTRGAVFTRRVFLTFVNVQSAGWA